VILSRAKVVLEFACDARRNKITIQHDWLENLVIEPEIAIALA
jgi:hypothetical protein